ncbi:hypothetical protein [Saccharococcus caldoxylosilyticus]|uniref:hypothetical protein n=1 Tax=Saccharococcus caldoxylosilyticus TaxID=81408 RepID=UPI001FCC4261|nr:hypothetical protein [Parageobacillus caldoxylosilyticus]BDG37516.1 hypothetical protein PcaKH15_34220 [Parageobacillus caldoxylosilyticus]BDG41307.1 hypothetical protein PcaKH16_34460 [Parageobacillus caldoxylosilyticus]
MDDLNHYRSICPSELAQLPVVNLYKELISGKRKALPSCTWEKDENVIIIVRYALEVHLGLKKEQIPKINRVVIKEQKLWGALNRFKSVRKLIQFVYPGRYNEFDFSRVPVNYWNNIQNIRDRLEWHLRREGIRIAEIPRKVNYDLLVEWGFSNPLKRHGHSPYRFMNALYPGRFKETDFKKIPQGYATNREFLKEQFMDMLRQEKIRFEDVPKKVTRQMLMKHRFSAALKHHRNSPLEFIQYLFPNQFSLDDFRTKPNGYWKDIDNVKREIMDLINREKVAEQDVPRFMTKQRLVEEGLTGLLHEYHGSPIEIIEAVFPGKYDVTEFQRVPNQHWHSPQNRAQALRTFCAKRGIGREELPRLNRAYFRKHFPRFISMVDRHYDSKFYRWIMESYPEYTFSPEEFRLLVGVDGQLCDSKEELEIHNFLIRAVVDGKVEREGCRFVNHEYDEVYIPDWVIEQNDRKWIVEYFGLYGSTRYKWYTEKADRKMQFYHSLADYTLIAIMPGDFRENGFRRIATLLISNGIQLHVHSSYCH